MALSNQISNPEYPEIQKYYRKIDFDNWRNHNWWENGEWERYLPIEEHHRWDKFYNQACKNKYNNYKKSPGYHFVEVLEMIELKKNGYEWLYENYYLFRNARPTEEKWWSGTEKIKEIIGKSKIDKLHKIASSMQLKPTEPDLFDYRKNNMIFGEVKREDKLSLKQKLGLDLIKKYLKIEFRIVRYKEALEGICLR